MIHLNLHSRRRVEVTPAVCYPSWEEFEMVGQKNYIILLADLMHSLTPSKLHRTHHKRHQLRHPSCAVLVHWRVGGLWKLEVSQIFSHEDRGILNLTAGPNITIFFTVLAVAVSFAWLGVEDPSKWETGVALYVIGCEPNHNCISIHSTLTFRQ